MTIIITILCVILLPILLKALWVLTAVSTNEKCDIMQRSAWLVQKTSSSPKELIESMPAKIGSQFQGEWAIYTYSMFEHALTNISTLYPETKEENLPVIKQLIEKAMSPEIQQYDKKKWYNEGPLDNFSSESSVRHLSYRSHLAWMLTNYKMAGGGKEYDELLHKLCDSMNYGIINSPAMNIPTYSDMTVYIPDMLVAILALHNYSILENGTYGETVKKWIEKAKKEWVDPQTGLLISEMSYEGNYHSPARGSYAALNTYYLALIDKEFAQDQYKHLKIWFVKDKGIAGCKEYDQNKKWLGFDIDAGPIIKNLSPSGTAFLTGCASVFKEKKLKKRLLVTAEIAGSTLQWMGKRHYWLAGIVPVGEAIMLAMRTSYN